MLRGGASMRRWLLWPVIFTVAVIDGCYDVLWSCVIVGQPAWMKGRSLMRDLAEVLRTK